MAAAAPEPVPFHLRRAGPADAPAIAELHVTCWRETYAGPLSDPALDALSVEERVFAWARMLTDRGRGAPRGVHLALRSGRPVGFGACARQRTPPLAAAGFDGEITALYVLAEAQRAGIGTALMRALAADLAAAGCTGMALWVLRDNRPARRFYERLGALRLAEHVEPAGDGRLPELAYGWPDLGAIVPR